MTGNLSRRGLLASLPALAATAAATSPTGLLPQSSAISSADPIFAIIEAHRAANKEWSDALRRKDAELEALGPGHDDKDAPSWPACERGDEREGVAHWDLWRTMPTTPVGFAALFAYLQTPRWPRQPEDTCDHDPMILYAVDNVWYSAFRSEDGDGGVPGLMAWFQMMELALRRMTVTA